MSQIMMCDGCGAVSNKMASKVTVFMLGEGTPEATRRNMGEYQAGIERDFCSDCTNNLLVERSLKVLEAKANGDL